MYRAIAILNLATWDIVMLPQAGTGAVGSVVCMYCCYLRGSWISSSQRSPCRSHGGSLGFQVALLVAVDQGGCLRLCQGLSEAMPHSGGSSLGTGLIRGGN